MKILLYIAVIFFSILLSMTAFAIQFKQPFHLIDDNAKMSYLHAIDITQRDKYVFKACKIFVCTLSSCLTLYDSVPGDYRAIRD